MRSQAPSHPPPPNLNHRTGYYGTFQGLFFRGFQCVPQTDAHPKRISKIKETEGVVGWQTGGLAWDTPHPPQNIPPTNTHARHRRQWKCSGSLRGFGEKGLHLIESGGRRDGRGGSDATDTTRTPLCATLL